MGTGKGEDPSAVVAWLLERMGSGQSGWEHPAFKPLLEGVTVEHALWRPAPERHCIWEIVRHMVHWRAALASRLRGDEAPGEDTPWPPLPGTRDRTELEQAWSADLQRLSRSHRELIDVVRGIEPGARHPAPDLAHLPGWIAPVGMQMHDSYHLGQIAVLRGMQGLPAVD